MGMPVFDVGKLLAKDEKHDDDSCSWSVAPSKEPTRREM